MPKNYNLSFDSSAFLNAYKRQWLLEHWGVISEVANNLKPKVSPQMVRMVFWGVRRSKRIERALRRRGVCLCPHEGKVRGKRGGRNV